MKFRVVLSTFDPTDKVHLNSDVFFFRPLSDEKLRDHPKNKNLMGSGSSYPQFPEFNERLDSYQRALMLWEYLLEELYHVPRLGINDDQGGLAEASNWENIE